MSAAESPLAAATDAVVHPTTTAGPADTTQTPTPAASPLPVGSTTPASATSATPALTHDWRGLGAGFTAYLLWAVFPLYFLLIPDSNPVEVVSHRVLWSLVFCAVGITATRTWAKVRQLAANRPLVGRLAIAGVLVTANWLIYVAAILTGHVVDAALGYFINPLVTVALGVIVLRERLRRAQLVALAICAIAVVVMVIGYGEFPVIGFGLALSFGTYALMKNRVGVRTTPLVGLGMETLTLTPVALGAIVYFELSGQGTFIGYSPTYTWALLGTGIVTAVPLIFFAQASGRLPLATVGLLQYVAPIGQFTIGVWIFHEAMPLARWIGFALIWVALMVLSADGLRGWRRPSVR